ncbi:hypothetical protein SAMN05444162_1066 [Paenibacillaceae bacterium GAS479]|nr:hypothetical protein SAMN05444162_1066 [Paenibacillaceae bacterium GAS479]
MIIHKLSIIQQMVEGNGLSADAAALSIQGVSIDSKTKTNVFC